MQADHDTLKRQVLGMSSMRQGSSSPPAGVGAEDGGAADREVRGASPESLEAVARLQAECEQKLEDLRRVTESVEAEGRQALRTEEEAKAQLLEASLEQQALREQVQELKGTSKRERDRAEVAVVAQKEAEEHLQDLEETSRSVLGDCRLLQARVRELEQDRNAMSELEVGLEEQRQKLTTRVRDLEQQRRELEDKRRELADENLSLSRQMGQLRLEMEGDVQAEIEALQHSERQLRNKLREADRKVTAGEEKGQQCAQLLQDIERERGQRETLRHRVAELEQADGRTQAQQLEARLVAEEALARAKAGEEHLRQRIRELEQAADSQQTQLRDERIVEDQLRRRVQELELAGDKAKTWNGELEKSRAAEEALQDRLRSAERCAQDRLRDAERAAERRLGEQQGRMQQLEYESQQRNESVQRLEWQHEEDQRRLQELRQELQANEELQRAVPGLQRELQAAKDLQQELQAAHQQKQDLQRELQAAHQQKQDLQRELQAAHKEQAAQAERQVDAQREASAEGERLKAMEQHLRDTERQLREAAARPADSAAVRMRIDGVDLGRLGPLQCDQLEGALAASLAGILGVEVGDVVGEQGRPGRVTLEEGEPQDGGPGQAYAEALVQPPPGRPLPFAPASSALASQASRDRLAAALRQVHGVQEASFAPIAVDVRIARTIEELADTGREDFERQRAEDAERRVKELGLQAQRRSEEHQRVLAESDDSRRHAHDLERELGALKSQLDQERERLRGEYEVRLGQAEDATRSRDVRIEELLGELESQRAKESSRGRARTTMQRTSYEEDLTFASSEDELGKPTAGRDSTMGHALSEARGSLVGEASLFKDMRGLVLPNSRNPFVGRVQEVAASALQLLDEASDLHFSSIMAQLRNVLEQYQEARRRGDDPQFKESAENYPERLVVEEERRTMAGRMERMLQGLRGLDSELQDQHSSLTTQEAEELGARLDLDARRCEEEILLLQRVSALGDLPESLVSTLMDVLNVGLRSLGKTWDAGFSPMHWAAQNSRRDILVFLMRQEGGMQLLQMHDDNGKTPLAYAMLIKGRSTLPQWLRENTTGVDSTPFRPTFSRPNVSLPEAYVKVLEQIETQGWQTIQWKNQFTMLHWAAGKGHVDLCEYLLQVNADLHAVDSQGRQPRDCAEQNQKREAVTFLREMEDSPMHVAMKWSSDVKQRSVSRMRSTTTMVIPGSSGSSRSPVSDASQKAVPEVYVKVMEQIDRIGWDKMQWARGFTLLHWAAKNDRPDLCGRFLRQGALVDHKDDSNRSAVDYARDNGSRSALQVLLAGPGALTGDQPVMGTLVSRKPRDSQPVIATEGLSPAGRQSVQRTRSDAGAASVDDSLDREVVEVTKSLTSPDPAVVVQACDRLAAVGPRAGSASPQLASILIDPDKGVRDAAATALAQIGPAAAPAAGHLVDLMKNDRSDVRNAAAGALAKIGPDGAWIGSRLVELVSDPRYEVRADAAVAFGNLADKAAPYAQHLVGLLHDGNWTVRKRAVIAFGNIGPSAATPFVPEIEKLLEDEDRDVVKAAKTTLEKLKE